MNTLAQLLTDFINSYVAGLQVATLQKWVDRLKFLYFTIYKMKTSNENNFDFLDGINDKDLKNEKPKNKQDLWDYLDGFSFATREEIAMAVCDFFVEEMGVINPSYWELVEYDELADEYVAQASIKRFIN